MFPGLEVRPKVAATDISCGPFSVPGALEGAHKRRRVWRENEDTNRPGRSMRWQSLGLEEAGGGAAPWATLLALGLPGWVLAVSATALWSPSIMPPRPASRRWTGYSRRGSLPPRAQGTDFVERYRQVSPPDTGSTGEWGSPQSQSGSAFGCQPPSQLADARLH